MAMAETQDTLPATSVRGKGWVTFDDNSDQVNSSNITPRRLSTSDETPGSLEVSMCPHQSSKMCYSESVLQIEQWTWKKRLKFISPVVFPSESGVSCDNVKLCSVVVLQYFLFGVKLFYLSVCNISTTASNCPANSKHTEHQQLVELSNTMYPRSRLQQITTICQLSVLI